MVEGSQLSKCLVCFLTRARKSLLVKGTAPEKIVPDKTLSDGGGAPEHQSLKPGTAELAQTPVWWESTIEGLWFTRLQEFLGKY